MKNAKNQVDGIFANLDVKLYKQGKRYVGRCPVHGGRGNDSLNFYPDGKEGISSWQCLSHQCEKQFIGTILGFIRGVLSHQELFWESPDDKKIPFQHAVNWLCDFLNMPLDSIKPNVESAENSRFASLLNDFNGHKDNGANKRKNDEYTREEIRSKLEIPPAYYVNRGFSPELLDRYDVGLCIDPNFEMYGRIVIPFYDSDYTISKGRLGRSPYEECKTCQTYHAPTVKCYSNGDMMRDYAKVRTNKNFKDKNFLYNWWFAKDEIDKAGTVIIVEGCADVWRAVSAGINNVVSISGAQLTDPQQIIIEGSKANVILCATDADESGEKAYEYMEERCRNYFKVIRVAPTKKDLADMSIEEIKHLFKNYV